MPGLGPPADAAVVAPIAQARPAASTIRIRLRMFVLPVGSSAVLHRPRADGSLGLFGQSGVDLTREAGDLLCQFLVLPGQIRVGLEQSLQLVRLGFDRSDAALGRVLCLVAVLFR